MRIALCSQEPLIGEALGSLLENVGNFDVVTRNSTPRDCLTAIKDLGVSVVVFEGNSLKSSDVEYVMGARTYGDFAVLLVGTPTEVEPERCEGLDCIVSRNEPSSTLFRSIREVGAHFVHARAANRAKKGVRNPDKGGLTKREYEIAGLIAKGFSNRRIAASTGLKEQSIKNAVSVVMRKLQCESRTQVAIKMTGWLTTGSETPV
jgi:DNA-binding NarL/FixJ family response regulator